MPNSIPDNENQDVSGENVSFPTGGIPRRIFADLPCMTVESYDCSKDKVKWEEDREHHDHPRRDKFGLDTVGDDEGCDETNRAAPLSALIMRVMTPIYSPDNKKPICYRILEEQYAQ